MPTSIATTPQELLHLYLRDALKLKIIRLSVK